MWLMGYQNGGGSVAKSASKMRHCHWESAHAIRGALRIETGVKSQKRRDLEHLFLWEKKKYWLSFRVLKNREHFWGAPSTGSLQFLLGFGSRLRYGVTKVQLNLPSFPSTLPFLTDWKRVALHGRTNTQFNMTHYLSTQQISPNL